MRYYSDTDVGKILRHGERTPVSARFQNVSVDLVLPKPELSQYLPKLGRPPRTYVTRIETLPDFLLNASEWPYCQAANRLAAAVMTSNGWDTLQYRRRLETFGVNDLPTIAAGPIGELNAIW